MGLWKKIKDRAKIVRGAIVTAVIGGTAIAGHWAYFKYGYERNVYILQERLDHVAYGGDGGINTPQRNAVSKSLKAYAPTMFRELGDLRYPDGLQSDAHLKEHVIEPYGDLGPRHTETALIVGNHDAMGWGQEKNWLAKKFYSTPVIEKIRFDGYLSLRVYYNACEVSYDSTVFDPKWNDPKSQGSTEEFVCKALNDKRCDGKLKIVLTHAGLFSDGSHGNHKSKDYQRFNERCIAGVADHMLAGHDHLTQYVRDYKGTQYWVAGALAKVKDGPKLKARPGYLTLDGGRIDIQYVDTVPFVDTEENE